MKSTGPFRLQLAFLGAAARAFFAGSLLVGCMLPPPSTNTAPHPQTRKSDNTAPPRQASEPKGHTDSEYGFEGRASQDEIYGRMTVQIHGVVVSPMKFRAKTPWDGPATQFDVSFQSAVGAYLKTMNPAALATLFYNPVLSAVDKPDVVGSITVLDQPERRSFSVPKTKNAYETDWSQIIWRDVDLTGDIRIEIKVTDKDVFDDDPIGTVQLNGADLIEAAESQKIFYVPVSDQSPNVLFVRVSVR